MPRPINAHPDILRARLRALVAADPREVPALAESAGLSAEHVRQVLRGTRRSPSAETVGKILAALGKSWGDLD